MAQKLAELAKAGGNRSETAARGFPARLGAELVTREAASDGDAEFTN
jgi:hypothetical protein